MTVAKLCFFAQFLLASLSILSPESKFKYHIQNVETLLTTTTTTTKI